MGHFGPKMTIFSDKNKTIREISISKSKKSTEKMNFEDFSEMKKPSKIINFMVFSFYPPGGLNR